MQRGIKTISLFLLAAVVVLRPLVAESYDSAQDPLSAALGVLEDPSPLRTLLFDMMVLVGTAGWALSYALGAAPAYRRTGLEWGTGCVAIAAVISSLVAGNQRLAVNASFDWLCYPILAISLTQLLDRPGHRRVVLAAILASACVQAAQCTEQYFVGIDEAWEHYQRDKESLWASQGVDPHSARVELYERRILAHEASGFLPHPNVAGSYLVLCAFAAVGLVIERWRALTLRSSVHRALAHPPGQPNDPPEPAVVSRLMGCFLAVGTTLGACFIAFAAALTKGLGAMLSAAAGTGLWAVCMLSRPLLRRHRARVFVAGWLIVLAGAAITIGYGMHYDRLPGWSLTFRWQYWKASANLIADHPLTGVGGENFGRNYLRYKEIESPEEVANPHNFLVQAAAEWGILGVVGIIAMLIGASRIVCLASNEDRPTARPRVSPQLADSTSPAIARWMLPLLFVVVIGRLPLLGTSEPHYLYYVSMLAGLTWLPTFYVFGLGATQTGETHRLDPVVGTSIAVGLFAFLLHDLINFAVFVPGAATTFFGLLAACLAGRASRATSFRTLYSFRRWLPFATSLVAIVIVSSAGLIPVARAGYYLRRARQAAREVVTAPIHSQLADHYFRTAAQADPLDPTPWVEHAKWLMVAAQDPRLRDDAMHQAAESLGRAIERDPHSVQLRRMRMQLYRVRATATGQTEDYLGAIRAAKDVLDLYPRDPNGLAELASCLLAAGEATGDESLLRRAIDAYRAALALDEKRLSWESLHRFQPKQRQAIEAGIAHAEQLLRQKP